MRCCRLFVATPWLLLLLSALSLSADEARILVEARDAKTGESLELRPQDFELLIGGEPVDVLTIGASPSTWQTLIYFDPVFGSRRGLASAARDLANEAGRFATLGRVEVHVASEVWLRPSRDPQLVHATLNQVADYLSSLPLASFERPAARPAQPTWLDATRVQRSRPGLLVWPLDDLGETSPEQIQRLAEQTTIQGWTLMPVKYLAPIPDLEGSEDTDAALKLFEESTAGIRILNPLSLGQVLEYLGHRRWVTYRNSSTPKDAQRVEIRPRRENLLVRAPMWTPEFRKSGVMTETRMAETRMTETRMPVPAVQLAPFHRPLVAGRVQVEPVVLGSEVQTVVFSLDGRPVATTQKPDFNAWIRLEKLPTPQVLETIARDVNGAVVGRDHLSVNVSSTRFETRITSPETITTAGVYPVRVEVSVPAGQRPEKVDLYWSEKQLYTFFRPPFEKLLKLPASDDSGYLRAVATLSDGRTSEDALISGMGFGERTEIDLVELHAVVVGPDGPVKNLSQARFRLVEDGRLAENDRPLELRFFGTAAEVPLNLGMAMDISFSMEGKMEVARQAALGFLGGLLRPADHTFLVTIQSRPVLVRPLTSDLELMSRAIADAEAGGATALYDSLMFSLIELRGLPGRKALVLLTHGGDQESQFNARQCSDFAQRFGIPVYVIALAGLRDAAQFKDLSSLRRIAQITGGAYFFIKNIGDLAHTYAGIADDLRSQYIFAFQPDPPSGKGKRKGWHPLSLEVEGPGLKVRTGGGYFLTSP